VPEAKTLDAMPDVLFIEDLCAIFRCSRRHLQRLTHRLPDPLPMEGRRRWSKRQVEKWLEGPQGRRGLLRLAS
jgi:hypothetical protein